jgi:hypothetical protein
MPLPAANEATGPDKNELPPRSPAMKRTLIIAAVAIATSLSAAALSPKTLKVGSKELSGVRAKASASAYEVVAQHPELKALVAHK